MGPRTTLVPKTQSLLLRWRDVNDSYSQDHKHSQLPGPEGISGFHGETLECALPHSLQGAHLGQMDSQLVPGILGLLQAILKCCVHHITLLAQVVGRLGQDSVYQGLQGQGVVSLLVSLLHIGVGEVQPIF